MFNIIFQEKFIFGVKFLQQTYFSHPQKCQNKQKLWYKPKKQISKNKQKWAQMNNQPTIGYSVHISITWFTTVRNFQINKTEKPSSSYGSSQSTRRATYRVVTGNTTSHIEYHHHGLVQANVCKCDP